MRKGLQRETRAAREDRHALAVTGLFKFKLGAVRQLADNVVEHMGGNGRGA